MRDPSRVRVSGPLESYAEDFRGELVGRGYSPDAAAVQLQVMGRLSGWLAGRGLDATGLTAAVVDAYLAGAPQLRVCQPLDASGVGARCWDSCDDGRLPRRR
jgi:hypothetical protein